MPELEILCIPNLVMRGQDGIHRGGDIELGIKDDLEITSQRRGRSELSSCTSFNETFKMSLSRAWVSITQKGRTSSQNPD